MLKLGLTPQDRLAFERALRSTHMRRVEVELLNPAEQVVSTISHHLLNGQVNVDLDSEVTRSASLEFLDPAHTLNFDTNSPDAGAIFMDRLIRVRYCVFVEELSRWVEVPVFVGPVTRLSRADDVVTVEAQGKEALTRSEIWSPLTLKKGALIVNAIRTLMVTRGGETRTSFPEVLARLTKAKTLPRNAQIWREALVLAASVTRQLFYNGDGVLVLRPWPGAVCYGFRTGDGGDVLTVPHVSYDVENAKNMIEVRGAPAEGKKEAVRAVAKAPADHPLSPVRLGRNGTQRYLVETVDAPHLKTNALALDHAERILNDRLREVVEVTFDSLPIPHLDPGDVVRVSTDAGAFTFRLRRFSIPLSADGAPVMSVGYMKRLTPNRKKIRS